MNSLLLITALLLNAAEDRSPVAMVLSTQGTVTLERGKDKPRPLAVMDLLRPGDRVTADAGAVLIFLDDNHRERLRPKIAVAVQAKGCRPAEAVEQLGPPPRATPAQSDSLRQLGDSPRGAGIALISGSKASPREADLDWRVRPMEGAAIFTDRPTLSWPKVDGASSYEVALFSGLVVPKIGSDPVGKDTPLWRRTTKEPSLPYPKEEQPLLFGFGGVYMWRVTVRVGDKDKLIVDSMFNVLTRDEVDKLAKLKPLVDSDDPADWVLAAVAYSAHGVADEALRMFERLTVKLPREPNFQVALAGYYERAGRTDLAEQARKRAKSLGAVLPEK